MKSASVLSLCLSAIAVVLSILVAVPDLRATLGEPVSSIESDRRVLAATKKAAPVTRDGYTVHEFQYGMTTVREYVGSSGIVFAIAWDGFTHPDLSEMLGKYADEYAQARADMPRGRGKQASRTVESARVTVQTWGHMRSLHGRAWAPELLPEGVSTDDIK